MKLLEKHRPTFSILAFHDPDKSQGCEQDHLARGVF